MPGSEHIVQRDDVQYDCLELVRPILGQRQMLAGFRDGHWGLQEEPRYRLPENNIDSYSEKVYRPRATPRESLDQRTPGTPMSAYVESNFLSVDE